MSTEAREHHRAVFGLQLDRKLDRHGVRVLGINYTCPQMQEALLRGASGALPVRLDPEDLTHVSVCIGHEWFSAEAVPQSVWGLSLGEWLDIVRDLRMRFREEAVLSEAIIREARKKIQAIDLRARQLRRVQPPQLTAEGLEQAERQLFMGLRIGPDNSAATGDLERRESRNRPDPDDLLGETIPPDGPRPRPMPDGGLPDSDGSGLGSNEDEWTFDG